VERALLSFNLPVPTARRHARCRFDDLAVVHAPPGGAPPRDRLAKH